MTDQQEAQLDREFAVWLTKHNFPSNLPERCLKPLRTAALLVSGFEAETSPSATTPAVAPFPPPADGEIKRFWVWLSDRQDNGRMLADEFAWAKKSCDPVSKDNPDPMTPPKWLLQRFRYQTEQ